MKLLLDMNLSARWVQYLNEAGFEAVHWSRLGSITASDDEIIAKARAEGYVIFTRDLDFGAMMFFVQADKPSIVQVRVEDARPELIGVDVVTALRQMEKELEEGALLTIDPLRSRLRLLPLGLRQ
ncbi:MAG: DUF5615 family PIN-like protein [Deltaproteobacteria bacterium]|jgi:predicted nuclease of predicted toxin-antitoxin system|nr:DUF5615 family PIN-like protein [Deltaproteobacteria bacterium]